MAEALNPDNVVAALLERVSAFARARATDESFISHDDGGPYLCFGDLGLYLREVLDRGPHTPEEAEAVRQSFALLDEMGNSPDPEVVNIAQVGVFESLRGRPECEAAARHYLTGEAAIWFERTATWGVSEWAAYWQGR
jgi:hypothetical protein